MKLVQVEMSSLPADISAALFTPPRFFRSLVSSIKAVGIIVPLLISENNGGYHLLDGRLRLLACRDLKLPPSTKLPALLLDDDAAQTLTAGLISNYVRGKPDTRLLMETVNTLVRRYRQNLNEVAARLGKSVSYLRDLLRINDLPLPTLQALERGELTISHCRRLIRLAKYPAELAEVTKIAVGNKLSSRDLETLISGKLRAKKKSPNDKVSSYSFFTPKVITTKSGSRLRFEPRQRSIRLELNIKPNDIGAAIEIIQREIPELA